MLHDLVNCTLLKKLSRYEHYSVKPSNVLAKEFFGENLPDLNVLAYNTSLQLVNTHFSVNSVRPLVPNVVEVAGLHIQKSHKVNEVKLVLQFKSFVSLKCFAVF